MRPIRRFSLIIGFMLLVISSTSISSAQNCPLFDAIEIGVRVVRSRINTHLLRYDEAIADMDAAIALEPDNPLLYVERGQRILLLYQWDRVLADYNHALELEPTYADAYYYRAILYASVPEGIDARHAALADFQRYLDFAPDGSYAADAARAADGIQAQFDALAASP